MVFIYLLFYLFFKALTLFIIAFFGKRRGLWLLCLKTRY